MPNTYCPLPFRHVFVEPRGIKPCCSYTEMFSGTIDQWLVSEQLSTLQHNIKNNALDPGCQYCIHGEQQDGTSTRLGAINDYQQIDLVTDIDYVDYRASNICNFRCRSCDPFYSNGIAQEARRHPVLLQYYDVPEKKLAPTTVEDKQWIKNNIGQIKRLMFTGGEPTCIPEVREIIEYIRTKRVQDISIMITSNASFTDQYWFDITKEMPNIHWTLSVDAVGPAAEIIRDGTDWPRVQHNIEQLFDLSSSVNIGTVITNLNVMNLEELFAFANQLMHRYAHRPNGRTHLIEICNRPEYSTPYNWPVEQRPTIIKYLSSILSNDLQPKQQQIIQTLMTNIENTKFDPVLWQQFVDFNKTLDNTRSQDHTVLLAK